MLSTNDAIDEVMMRSVEDNNSNNNIKMANMNMNSRITELPLNVMSMISKSGSSTTLTSPSTPSSCSTLSSPMSSSTNTTLLYNTTSGTLLNVAFDVLNNNSTKTNDDQQLQPNAKPHKTTSTPLPEILESIQKASHFPIVRHRWNTNEEIAALLIALERQDEWLSQEVKLR